MKRMITTARLRLRPPRPHDAPALFAAYTSDPEVTRYVTWSPHQSVADTAAFIDSRIANWKTGESYAWVIVVDGEAVGMIEMRPNAETNLGYVLARRCWGRGIVTEAVRAVVAEARAQGWPAVKTWCDADNTGSACVLEKSGFKFVRRGPGPVPLPAFGGAIRDALFYRDNRDAGTRPGRAS